MSVPQQSKFYEEFDRNLQLREFIW